MRCPCSCLRQKKHELTLDVGCSSKELSGKVPLGEMRDDSTGMNEDLPLEYPAAKHPRALPTVISCYHTLR
jgi:hypothetical protein